MSQTLRNVALLVVLALILSARPVHAQRQPPPGKTWAQVNPVRPAARVVASRKSVKPEPSRREIVLRWKLKQQQNRRIVQKLRRELRKEQASNVKRRESLTDLTLGESGPPEPLLADLSDEELASKIGLNQTTGEQSNPARKAIKLEIDTWAGYVHKADDIKVGPSLVLVRRGKLKGNLDVANSFIGASLNYELAPIIRPAIGAGIGYETARNEWMAYGKASVKIW